MLGVPNEFAPFGPIPAQSVDAAHAFVHQPDVHVSPALHATPDPHGSPTPSWLHTWHSAAAQFKNVLKRSSPSVESISHALTQLGPPPHDCKQPKMVQQGVFSWQFWSA